MMDIKTVYKIIGDGFLSTHPVGSRVSCYPAPTDTDDDHLILVNNMYDPDCLIYHGFNQDVGDDHYEGEDSLFASFRHGDLNLIITTNKDFYDKFVMATEIATKLNLLKKNCRIALFKAILYGE